MTVNNTSPGRPGAPLNPDTNPLTDPVFTAATLGVLERIASALERLAPAPLTMPDWDRSWAWVADPNGLTPAETGLSAPLEWLIGVDEARDILLTNTLGFARGLIANNALLWGARGVGKSALARAVAAKVAADHRDLKLVHLAPDRIADAPALIQALAHAPVRIILFLDDLAIDAEGPALRALKPALDGGISGPTGRLLVYATANRRHIVPRQSDENVAEDLAWRDTAESRLAISDRFGLSLGFHPWDQTTYLAAVAAYARRFNLLVENLEREAIAWALRRGARSGRTAWQFIVAQAAQQGVDLRRQF